MDDARCRVGEGSGRDAGIPEGVSAAAAGAEVAVGGDCGFLRGGGSVGVVVDHFWARDGGLEAGDWSFETAVGSFETGVGGLETAFVGHVVS